MQDLICGRAEELPLNFVVKPNVFPDPFDRMVMTKPPPSQLGVPLHVDDTRCGDVSAGTDIRCAR